FLDIDKSYDVYKEFMTHRIKKEQSFLKNKQYNDNPFVSVHDNISLFPNIQNDSRLQYSRSANSRNEISKKIQDLLIKGKYDAQNLQDFPDYIQAKINNDESNF
ncbi:MAG: hypothetical protein MHPSP_003370, partial [Paramarteilia canceri]